jgi:dTDP-4-amino-4,6-dideoxygalactose transaminase
VPFVNYPLQYKNIRKEVLNKIDKTLLAGDLIYRKDLQDFEKKIAAYCGVKDGIATDSCTGALFIALKALGIEKGDEVITVGHTYIATIDVIIHCVGGCRKRLQHQSRSDRESYHKQDEGHYTSPS